MQLILYFITPHSFMTDISATIKTTVQKMLNHRKCSILYISGLDGCFKLRSCSDGLCSIPWMCAPTCSGSSDTSAAVSLFLLQFISFPDVTDSWGTGDVVMTLKGLSHIWTVLFTDQFQDLARGEGIFRNDGTGHDAGWRILTKRIFIGLFWRFDQCTAQ